MDISKRAKRLIEIRIHRHRYRDIETLGSQDTLTYADFLEKFKDQDGLCYWTGLPLTLDENELTSVSIDRLDTTKGHSKDNVVLCQRALNFAGNFCSPEDFRAWLESIRIRP